MQLARRRRGTCICAPHILLSPTFRASRARVENGDIGSCCSARARYGWRDPTGPLVLPARRRRALRPRRLQRHLAVRPPRAGAARDRHGRRRDPRARRRGRADAGQAEDNAHVLLDFGDAPLRLGRDGLHDAEVPLAGDRAVRLRRRAAAARRRLGARGLRAVAQRARLVGGRSRERPGWQWTDGLQHLVECIERGRAPVTRPEHAYHALEIMLAARRRPPTGARGRSRAISRAPNSRPLETSRTGTPVDDPRSALI